MDEGLIRQANDIVNAKDIQLALKGLRELYMEEVVLTAKSMYDECINVGFSEEQAHDIAKSYILEFCALEFMDDDE